MSETESQALLLAMQQWQQRIEKVLHRELLAQDSGSDVPGQLLAAMQYALLDGGKRLRPMLAYAAAEAVGGHYQSADIAACAVECIHAYSLIHDDLPAMDDDVLRRGKATTHIAFDDATAILAGDALQTMAFELLAVSRQLCCGNQTRLAMLRELTQASGKNGMVGGQALDIAAAGGSLSEAQLSHMHSMKTGALIRASVLTGAMSTNLASTAQLEHLRRFAELAGLAFQIRDDILDVSSSAEISGKEQGKDARLNKPTYTSLLGIDTAQQRLQVVCDAALESLAVFGDDGRHLQALTRFIVERKA